MKTAVLISTLALLAAASPAAAQFAEVKPAPKTWVSAWAGAHMSPGTVRDPVGDAQETWDFGSAFGGGLGVHRQVGQSLVLGVEGSFSPVAYEHTAVDGVKTEEKARLVTGLLSGRLRYGGSDAFGMYLTGGAGAFVYGLPELGRWDPDLAVKTGAGLEYRPSLNRALYVEWGRFWTFHQKSGVKDNSTKHSEFRVGARMGL